MLRTIAEHENAGDRAAGVGPHRILDGGTDRRLVGRLRVGPSRQRQRVVRHRWHGPHVAVEHGERHVEVPASYQRLGGGPGGGERFDQVLPAAASVDAIGHGHALRGIGQHDHGAPLRRLPRSHHGGPCQAGHQRQERPQSQHDEQGEPAARHPRPIGWYGHEYGHEHRRDERHEPPRPHRVEVHRDLFQAPRIGHASSRKTGGSGGGPVEMGGDGSGGAGPGSAASANVAAAPRATSAPSRGA